MKFLQDLVPGCNKIAGKVVMLDEIINYVQSLQRQVELELKAWKNAHDNTGFTPEDYAIARGHQSYITLMQKKIN